MAERKPFLGTPARHEALEATLKAAVQRGVSDAELQEQRVSFAYGNAPERSKITKETIRHASQTMRMVHAG